MTKSFIGVCRVSTREQGQSKNGLESQRAEIERWAAHNGYSLITIMDEVISGSTPLKDRPVMSMALAMAKKMKAQVVVTKSDRCSRDFDISRELMQKKKLVVAIDLGEDADSFVEIIFSGLAEKERKMIGQRTKAGLAAAKARGVVLGNRTNLPVARELAAAAIKEKADRFAARVRPPIERMVKCGMTYAEIAQELNEQHTPTARGGEWSATSVCRIISRWK
jgi:DNA invertase Pin-like site-specific DNA recombinase